MHKKYHEKIKILDILAVTTQAREGIETLPDENLGRSGRVTTQAREGIETTRFDNTVWDFCVTTQDPSSACPRQKIGSRNKT